MSLVIGHSTRVWITKLNMQRSARHVNFRQIVPRRGQFDPQ